MWAAFVPENARMIGQSRFVESPSDPDRRRIADLTDTEQLMVWGFRTWAFAHHASRSVERDLRKGCGREEGEWVTVAIRSVLVLIALYGRRPLRLAPPGWPAVTTDEIRLLQLFSAGQRGAAEGVQAHLTWLLRPGHGAHPEIAVGHAAAILGRSGFALPWRYERAEPIGVPATVPLAPAYAGRLRL